MKSKIIAAIAAMALLTAHASAQDEDNADKFSATGKVLKHVDKFGIAQLIVSYKLTSTGGASGKSSSNGHMAAAKVTAYLEPTDGELTAADFQEVTDYFYGYFQKKLKASGIDTVPWSAITATDFYKDANERTVTNDQEKAAGGNQVWVTCSAHQGNILYGGFAAFGLGKIKKASNFCDEIGGAAGFFYLTVDFVDNIVGVKVSSTEIDYSSETRSEMLILPSEGNYCTLLWNAKSQNEMANLDKTIHTGIACQTSITQDPSRLRTKAFAFARSMKPVVVETTRDKYKSAAKAALEKYADAFVAMAKEMRGE